MKKFISLCIAALAVAFVPMGIANAKEKQAAAIPSLSAEEIATLREGMSANIVKVKVDGMVCDFCAQSLTKVIGKNEAVEKVDISLETKVVTITVKDGKQLDDAAIQKAVTWAGYTIAGIVRPETSAEGAL